MAPPSLLCLQVRYAYPQLQVYRPKIPYAKRSRPKIPLNDSEWASIHQNKDTDPRLPLMTCSFNYHIMGDDGYILTLAGCKGAQYRKIS